MNRTLLLENLPDLLEDLDARLTALEAAKPQAPQTVSQWRESLFAARLDRDAALEEVEALIAERDNLEFSIGAAADKIRHLAAEVKERTYERDNLSAFVDALKTDNKRLTDGFYALEAQRNALAAQLDDLRNVNAGLRKDNERLAAEVTRLKGSIVATVNEIDQDLATDNAQLRQDNALMMADKRQLRAALEAVEYDGEYGTCLWCSSLYGYEHFQNCQRQAALR